MGGNLLRGLVALGVVEVHANVFCVDNGHNGVEKQVGPKLLVQPGVGDGEGTWVTGEERG